MTELNELQKLRADESLVKDAAVYLKKGEGRAFRAGSAWIYDNEIERTEGTFADGDIVTVRACDGWFLCYGYINRQSVISIRALSRREDAPVTPALLAERVRKAWEYRKAVVDTSSCRVIFGEADYLPGITIDKYEDILVVESLALGIDRLKMLILDALVQVLAQDGIRIRGIYERSDAKVREKEGLPRVKGFIGEPFDTRVQITENGVKYIVDVENGQKTGFFLDQKENRAAVQRLVGRLAKERERQREGAFRDSENLSGAVSGSSENLSEVVSGSSENLSEVVSGSSENLSGAVSGSGKKLPDSVSDITVLDCFTHTGSFALNAALAGAAHVTAVDASDTAILQAEENARLNGLEDRMEFVCADVFALLPELEQQGKQYDLVILDPPAFTKARNSVKAAAKGYREINRRGMALVRNGGYFATCSCSHFMDPELFSQTIAQAAKDAHVRLRQIEFRTQASDHPILWNAEESYYLKFYLFQVVREG